MPIDKNATGRNFANKQTPIGYNIEPWRFDTEGTDANGRYTVITKDEFPTRIHEVSKTLFYLGWAELNSAEDEEVWKIRRIRKLNTVWYQEYAYSNQFYRYKWTERSFLPYA